MNLKAEAERGLALGLALVAGPFVLASLWLLLPPWVPLVALTIGTLLVIRRAARYLAERSQRW